MTMLKLYALAFLVFVQNITDGSPHASLIQPNPIIQSNEYEDPKIDDVARINEAETLGREASSNKKPSISMDSGNLNKIQNSPLINDFQKKAFGNRLSSGDRNREGLAKDLSYSNSGKQDVLFNSVPDRPSTSNNINYTIKSVALDNKTSETVDTDDHRLYQNSSEDTYALTVKGGENNITESISNKKGNPHKETKNILKVPHLLPAKVLLNDQAIKQDNNTTENTDLEGNKTEAIDQNETNYNVSSSTNDQTPRENADFPSLSNIKNSFPGVTEIVSEKIIEEESVNEISYDELETKPKDEDETTSNETSDQGVDELSDCPTCGKNGLAEDDVKLIRLSMFKDILAQKLRINPDDSIMAEAQPSVRTPSAVPKLPRTILKETLKDNVREIEKDQFYARDEEIIISGEDMGEDCIEAKAMGCYSFDLKDKIKWEVFEAQLWFYKTRDFNDIKGQIITVSELKKLEGGELANPNVIARQTIYNKNGWTHINVTGAILETLNMKNYVQVLAIQCSTCWTSNHTELFGASLGYKPLLVIKYAPNNAVIRKKRSEPCDPRLTCCKRDLNVNFHEINMIEVLEPRNMSIGYCYGACNGIGQYSNNHTQIKQHVRNSDIYANHPTMNQQLKPCCVPLVLKDAFLMTIENNDVVRKIVPKVIVETCGCM